MFNIKKKKLKKRAVLVRHKGRWNVYDRILKQYMNGSGSDTKKEGEEVYNEYMAFLRFERDGGNKSECCRADCGKDCIENRSS